MKVPGRGNRKNEESYYGKEELDTVQESEELNYMQNTENEKEYETT